MDDQNNTLIPSWTYDDFMTEEPYRWLFNQRGNKFLLQRMIEAAKKQARDVKFSGFIKVWNSFVEMNSPKSSILGESDTMFPGRTPHGSTTGSMGRLSFGSSVDVCISTEANGTLRFLPWLQYTEKRR